MISEIGLKQHISENNQNEKVVVGGNQLHIKVKKNERIKTGLSILYTNADQYLNKRDDLAMMIVDEKPDIILITEVIPKSQTNPINPSLLSLDGYNYHLNFNPDESYLGKSGIRGVLIYFKVSLIINEVNLEMEGFKDHVWIEVIGKRSSLLIGCLYRSPSDESISGLTESIKKVNSLIEKAYKMNRNLVIAGDFNLKDIDWENDHVPVDKDYLKNFIQTLQENYLTQHITEPTRFRDNQESNVLDLVISSREEIIHGLRYLPPLGNSDHICLDFTAIFETDEPPPRSARRNIFKGNYVAMKGYLNSVNWDEITSGNFVDAYDRFAAKLKFCIDKYCPLKNPPKMRKNLYMNREALQLKNIKIRAWKSFKSNPCSYTRKAFCKSKNKLRAFTRNLRNEYEGYIARNVKSKPKLFWNYVRSRTSVRQPIPTLKTDNVYATTDQSKAEVLNNFFTSVFTIEDETSIPEPTPVTETKLKYIKFTPEMVQKKLNSLDPNKSPGHDEFHPHFLKELATVIAHPLSTLFNKSLRSGAHSSWKKAIITAVFKKGDKSTPNNYRPVSLTSVLSKIMESIVRDHMLKHLMDNNLLCDNQHGFVPKRDCMSQLLVCLEEWTQQLEDRETIDIIYTDFMKAFDSVAHKRLLVKLRNLGFEGDILKWIESLLTNRIQSVKINDSTSKWSKVLSGIPQGSVIGPLLFIIFINDMPKIIKNSCKLFADDCKVYGGSSRNNSSLQTDLDSMYNWSKTWQLPFNVTKCKRMHLGKKNELTEYIMGNHQLEETTNEKDLGVYIDNDLKFHLHASKAIKKANRILGTIKNSCSSRDKTFICNLYKTMVRPHLEYGNSIWGPFYKKDIEGVERVQRRATKMAMGLHNTPYQKRLEILKLPSLVYRRRRGDMIQLYKLVNGLYRLELNELVTRANSRTRGHQFKLVKKKGYHPSKNTCILNKNCQ